MFIEFETIVQVKRFQYLSDAITEIILANGGRSGCAGATAPTRSTRRRRTAWLNSKRCISNLVFDTTLSSGREMGIRPTAIARREEVAADRTRTRGRRMSHLSPAIQAAVFASTGKAASTHNEPNVARMQSAAAIGGLLGMAASPPERL